MPLNAAELGSSNTNCDKNLSRSGEKAAATLGATDGGDATPALVLVGSDRAVAGARRMAVAQLAFGVYDVLKVRARCRREPGRLLRLPQRCRRRAKRLPLREMCASPLPSLPLFSSNRDVRLSNSKPNIQYKQMMISAASHGHMHCDFSFQYLQTLL